MPKWTSIKFSNKKFAYICPLTISDPLPQLIKIYFYHYPYLFYLHIVKCIFCVFVQCMAKILGQHWTCAGWTRTLHVAKVNDRCSHDLHANFPIFILLLALFYLMPVTPAISHFMLFALPVTAFCNGVNFWTSMHHFNIVTCAACEYGF